MDFCKKKKMLERPTIITFWKAKEPSRTFFHLHLADVRKFFLDAVKSIPLAISERYAIMLGFPRFGTKRCKANLSIIANIFESPLNFLISDANPISNFGIKGSGKGLVFFVSPRFSKDGILIATFGHGILKIQLVSPGALTVTFALRGWKGLPAVRAVCSCLINQDLQDGNQNLVQNRIVSKFLGRILLYLRLVGWS